jgi:hypothetical protein
MRNWIIRALLAWLGIAGTASIAEAYQEPIVRPARLCIYYGWPSYVNGSQGNAAAATSQFLNCDVFVLGDGIEHPEHGDHQNARSIIGNLIGAGRRVFGYVDLGVSTQNLSVPQMQQYVDEWRAMGVTGIFFDDAGFDYQVTRVRQNLMVDYVHSLGMKVFLNAWMIDDALGDMDETGARNPSRMAAGDWYLAESWLIAGGSYQSIADWTVKADKALAYARAKRINIAAVSTAGINKALAKDSSNDKFKMSWWAAAMYGLAAWQWTDASYSSASNTLRAYGPIAPANYGASFADPGVAHGSGRTPVHTRRTNTGTISVSGDGSRRGTGSFR